MESIYNHSVNEHNTLKKRLQIINRCTNRVDQHILFKDGLNFNFLYHLYSQKLTSLLNGLESLSEQEFSENFTMLEQSVKEISAYILK